jgi:hypothetical protein
MKIDGVKLNIRIDQGPSVSDLKVFQFILLDDEIPMKSVSKQLSGSYRFIELWYLIGGASLKLLDRAQDLPDPFELK